MPKNDRCPDCGLKLNDPNHPALTPTPAEWSVADFVRVLEQDWQFNPASARVCCGVSALAAVMRQAKVPKQHVMHVVSPRLLWDLYSHGLRKKVLRGLILWTYVHSTVPLMRLSAEQWIEMFRHAGYTEFDEKGSVLKGFPRSPRPEEVPVLYRTAEDACRVGMSWTSSRSHAELFGLRRAALDGSPVNLYRLEGVDPSRVLGTHRFRVGAPRPDKRVVDSRGLKPLGVGRADEWVIDASGLEPELVPLPPCGCKIHWGDVGAAGLLVGRRKNGRITHVLLQRRGIDTVVWGDTWSIPGGALEPGEDDRSAALREAVEETGIDVSALDVVGEFRDDSHGADWHYTTVLAVADRKLDVNTDSPETEELRWVRLDDVEDMDLHPGFAKTWPGLRVRLEGGTSEPAFHLAPHS